jgi:SAM-dependent methyltransferase
MQDQLFDKVAGDYDQLLEDNLGTYGKDISYYAEYKIITISENLVHPPRSILEFGCGIGRNMPFLQKYFPQAEICGTDTSAESLELARKSYPQIHFLNEHELYRGDRVFDLIVVANVFHHILPEQRMEVMVAIASLLSDGGELFVFEHNPFNPLTVRAVNTCPFDKDAVLLKAGELRSYTQQTDLRIIGSKYCLFFPAALKSLRRTEKFISRIPLGGQYFIHAQKREA